MKPVFTETRAQGPPAAAVARSQTCHIFPNWLRKWSIFATQVWFSEYKIKYEVLLNFSNKAFKRTTKRHAILGIFIDLQKRLIPSTMMHCCKN
mgnify:CR=1 FL=1